MGGEFLSISTDLTSRTQFGKFLNKNKLLGDAVEVGVWRGYFSAALMEHWDGRKLHLVDPWKKLDDYDDIRNRDFDPNDYEIAKATFAQYGDRVVMHQMLSVSAAKTLPNNLDFVYIDANHAYDHVTQDLHLWWQKVRNGGVLAGHDFFSMKHPSVTQAVMEFAVYRKHMIEIIPGDFNEHGMQINEPSWMIRKNW
jgi:hypothetical protein